MARSRVLSWFITSFRSPSVASLSLSALLVFAATSSSFAAPRLIPSPPAIAAKGYILMDANSGKVIIEKNADEILVKAS